MRSSIKREIEFQTFSDMSLVDRWLFVWNSARKISVKVSKERGIYSRLAQENQYAKASTKSCFCPCVRVRGLKQALDCLPVVCWLFAFPWAPRARLWRQIPGQTPGQTNCTKMMSRMCLQVAFLLLCLVQSGAPWAFSPTHFHAVKIADFIPKSVIIPVSCNF